MVISPLSNSSPGHAWSLTGTLLLTGPRTLLCTQQDPDHQLPLREKSSSVVTKIMFRLSRMTIRWLLLPAFCKRSSENQSKVPQVSLVQLCVTAPGDGFMKQKSVLPAALRCQDHSQPLWSSTRYPFRDETLSTSSLLMDPLHQQVYQKWGLSGNLPAKEWL